jgi:hypothetical protein
LNLSLPPTLSRYRLWLYFFILAAANFLLSAASLSYPLKALVFVLGILLPLAAATRDQSNWGGPPNGLQDEFFPSIPGWLWFLAGAGALFVRFYHLDSLFLWPNGDESLHSMLAIDLTEKWTWKFFYTAGQHPPLLIWVLSLFFRLFQSPFLSFWLVPALAATLTLPFAYLILRARFSKSLSFVGLCLLGFSLWPFYCGRWCQQGVLIPPWECLCIFLLVVFLKEETPASQKKWAALLGLTAGLGSFTFTTWPFVALMVLLAVFGGSFSRMRKNKIYIPYFFGPFLAAVIPFLLAVKREGFGGHIGAMSFLSGWYSLQHQGLTVLSYLGSLFWGTLEGDSVYIADSGGLLNPFLGAAFFLGMIQLYRFRSQAWARWTAAAFFIGFAPGFLSMNVEMFRVVQVLPFLLLITALGLSALLATLPAKRRLGVFLMLMAVSAFLDGSVILRSHVNPLTLPPPVKTRLPIGEMRAYQILKTTSDRFGNGLLFTEFVETPFDQSPFVTTYAFNAAENPRLDPSKASWAAVLTNVDYRDFLAPRFTGARWFWLDQDQPSGKLLLGLIPMNAPNQPILARWTQAHHYFRQLSRETNNISESQTYSAARAAFDQPVSWIQGDRFLESCYWDKRAEFDYYYNYQAHYEDQLHALRQAVARGYPAANLNYKLGSLLLRKKEFPEARRAFEAALRADPQDKDVQDALGILDLLERSSARVK